MIKAFIDRIENDCAVLVISDDATTQAARQIDVPVGLLPADCAPGDHLTIAIERAPDNTAATRQTIAQLKTELMQASDAQQLDFKL